MVRINSQNISDLKSKDVESLYRDFLESDIPFISVLQDLDLWDAARDFSAALKKEFETLVVVGIGGSHLGAESFLKALTFPRNVVFLENPDPVGICRRWNSIANHSKAHFMFISRSGNTLETTAIANWVIGSLEKMGLPIDRHCSVLTANQKSPLKVWADKTGAKSLMVPEELSGRYSALSPVGVIPLLFGLDCGQEKFFQDFFKGAERALGEMKVATDLVHVYREIVEGDFKFFNLWFYSDQMLGFGKWLRQLWSESLGQHDVPHSWGLPSIVMCKGASDQHSYLQQVIAQPKGHVNLVLTLKDLKDYKIDPVIHKDYIETKWTFSKKSFFELFNMESQGLINTFKKENIPYLHLEVDAIELSSLVQFILLQQLVVSHLGLSSGIDPFDQPEVEKMKRHVLDLF